MANQYKVDPRQALFLKAYLDPKSATFSNAYQSALAVGYTEEYASTILSKELDWLSDNVRTDQMISKAEKKLDQLLDSKDERVSADVSKFVASRLGKKKWSERQEHTDGEGKPVPLLANIYVRTNNSTNEAIEPKEEN